VSWSEILYETFESGAPGWQAVGVPVPAITTYRAVAGSRSAYMTGGGVAPPGPYPNNSSSQLHSPLLNLAGFEEVYVDLWFFARYEDPQPPDFFDYALVFLVQGTSSYLLEPLIVPYTGDLAADPTSFNGWRHMVARVPPSWRLNGVKVVVQFTSDVSIGAEGVYVDEVWVGGTPDVDSELIGNDSYSARQYELKNAGQIANFGDDTNDLNAPEAWAAQAVSPGVVLAIIDDGVEAHGDLNLVTGYDATTGGIGGGPTSVDAAHGQACAGNAGAIRNNAAGVAGTAPGVKIMPVNGGATEGTLANGINLAVVGGAHVLSNSWGWVGAPNATIQAAIVNALNAGRTVLFAAGNGPDRPPYTYETAFPCNLTASTSLVCVGASSPADEHKGAASADGIFTWGSSYVGAGPDVVAPGPWSYTTDRPGNLGYNPPPAGVPATGIDLSYTHDFGGTSSATPKVAGVAALILSANSTLSGAQVKAILQATAKDIATAGVDDRTGAGRVDALAAVNAARPNLSIADGSAVEGGTGTSTPLSLTVTLSAPSAGVIVNYATVDGSAVANSDYLPVSGTLNIPAGASSRPGGRRGLLRRARQRHGRGRRGRHGDGHHPQRRLRRLHH
jgi:subtilisin family serine protease